MNKTSLTAVCNTGPVIHLDELECLDLLADFPRVVVPHTVAREAAAIRTLDLTKIGIDIVPDPAADLCNVATARVMCLHRGEMAAIILSQHFENSIFLTDDAAARIAAKQMNIKVHGTIGILIRGIRRKKRTTSETIQILKSIPHKSTLHIHNNLLNYAINKVKSIKNNNKS